MNLTGDLELDKKLKNLKKVGVGPLLPTIIIIIIVLCLETGCN